MRRFERVARAAMARAGALIRTRHGAAHAVSHKAVSAVDLVTATDREIEVLITTALLDAFPDHGIVSEESPPRPGRGPYRWYIDPLDGTTNFVHGYPRCAVSVALAHGDGVILGLVHDPLRRETFVARRGAGARLNGRPIRVSAASTLTQALVGTGFPYDHREHAAVYAPFLEAALERVRCLRRSGSAALDPCYVACGRLDAYWDWGLGPWDAAAGRLIVEEAHGRVTTFRGQAHVLGGRETAASNGFLHDDLVAMLDEGARRARAHAVERDLGVDAPVDPRRVDAPEGL